MLHTPGFPAIRYVEKSASECDRPKLTQMFTSVSSCSAFVNKQMYGIVSTDWFYNLVDYIRGTKSSPPGPCDMTPVLDATNPEVLSNMATKRMRVYPVHTALIAARTTSNLVAISATAYNYFISTFGGHHVVRQAVSSMGAIHLDIRSAPVELIIKKTRERYRVAISFFAKGAVLSQTIAENTEFLGINAEDAYDLMISEDVFFSNRHAINTLITRHRSPLVVHLLQEDETFHDAAEPFDDCSALDDLDAQSVESAPSPRGVTAIKRLRVNEVKPQITHGPVGIMNIGNKCYANAALQLFANCPGIVHALMDPKNHELLRPEHANWNGGILSLLMINFMRTYTSLPPGGCLGPTRFFDGLGYVNSTFRDRTQEDSDFAMTTFLEVHEDLLTMDTRPTYEIQDYSGAEGTTEEGVFAQSKRDFNRRNDSPLLGIYHAWLRKKIWCECGEFRVRHTCVTNMSVHLSMRTNFYLVHLQPGNIKSLRLDMDVPKGDTIEQVLRSVFERNREKLLEDGDEEARVVGARLIHNVTLVGRELRMDEIIAEVLENIDANTTQIIAFVVRKSDKVAIRTPEKDDYVARSRTNGAHPVDTDDTTSFWHCAEPFLKEGVTARDDATKGRVMKQLKSLRVRMLTCKFDATKLVTTLEHTMVRIPKCVHRIPWTTLVTALTFLCDESDEMFSITDMMERSTMDILESAGMFDKDATDTKWNGSTGMTMPIMSPHLADKADRKRKLLRSMSAYPSPNILGGIHMGGEECPYYTFVYAIGTEHDKFVLIGRPIVVAVDPGVTTYANIVNACQERIMARTECTHISFHVYNITTLEIVRPLVEEDMGRPFDLGGAFTIAVQKTEAPEEDLTEYNTNMWRLMIERLPSKTMLELMKDDMEVHQHVDGERWRCPKCEGAKHTFEQTKFMEVPSNLFVNVKIFEFNEAAAGFVRHSNPIKLPTEFDIRPFMHKGEDIEESDDFIYELRGFVRHLGDTIHGGHYISYVKAPFCDAPDKWFCVDDSRVSEVTGDISDVLWNAGIYILMYTKKSVISSPKFRELPTPISDDDMRELAKRMLPSMVKRAKVSAETLDIEGLFAAPYNASSSFPAYRVGGRMGLGTGFNLMGLGTGLGMRNHMRAPPTSVPTYRVNNVDDGATDYGDSDFGEDGGFDVFGNGGGGGGGWSMRDAERKVKQAALEEVERKQGGIC